MDTVLPSGRVIAATEEPARAYAGRVRRPSEFDEILPDLKDKGWQSVTVNVDEGEDPEYVKNELQRSADHHKTEDNPNGLGLDIHPTWDKGATEHGEVKFRVRDKLQRAMGAPRPAPEEDEGESFEDIPEWGDDE